MNSGPVPLPYFTIDDFVKYKYVEKYGQPEKQDIWVTYDVVASSTSATAVRIPPSSEEELFMTPEIEEQIKDFETTVASIDIGETYVTIRMS